MRLSVDDAHGTELVRVNLAINVNSNLRFKPLRRTCRGGEGGVEVVQLGVSALL